MFVWVRVPFPVLIKLTMKQYYRKFKQGIGNLIYYFKVIWNDRQWDYAFFYRLELKKVQKMIQWWSSGDNVTSEKSVLRDLRICEYLLKVLSEEIDNMEMISTNPVKYEFTRYVNLKNISRFIPSDQSDLVKEWSKKPWLKEDMYILKCKNLYYTIRNYRMGIWWD